MKKAKQVTSSKEIDCTYYEAQPPRMVDGKTFPPTESMRGEMGRAELKLDDVLDPDYPWQMLDHDSPGGKRRMEEIKRRKAAAVKDYVVIHTRFWQQFREPLYYSGDRTEIFSYTIGHNRAQSSSVEAGIEISLGLQEGMFKGELKGSLKWTSRTEESFSESATKTIEQHYQGDCWYLFWQTMTDLTVYRRKKESPDVLEQVKIIVAPSNLVMMDPFPRPKVEGKPKMPLRASTVTLDQGKSHVFGGYVFANTKVYVKNSSNNDDGQLTLSWLGLGGKIIIDLGLEETKHVSKYLPIDFRAINSGVAQLKVWTDT
jgi:hypothetical protein